MQVACAEELVRRAEPHFCPNGYRRFGTECIANMGFYASAVPEPSSKTCCGEGRA